LYLQPAAFREIRFILTGPMNGILNPRAAPVPRAAKRGLSEFDQHFLILVYANRQYSVIPKHKFNNKLEDFREILRRKIK
jgi:hypothetical protein